MTYDKNWEIQSGEIVELEICSLVANDAGNGFTAWLCGGGVICLRLTPLAQQEHRRRSRHDWPLERRETVLRVLDAWQSATGKAYKHGLEHHAKQLGVEYSEIKAAFFWDRGRTAPPLRAEYERGLARRRDAFNMAKKMGRIGGRA